MLKISKKADYALMALQHMACVQFGDTPTGRVVNTKEIAEEYNIPLELLAKVLQALSKNGMIESHNGPKGGYVLARSAREITIAQILESIEGPVAKIIAVIIIIVTGLTLAFGDTSGGFRRLIQIVFGLSIAFAASSFFLSFFSFGGGALV